MQQLTAIEGTGKEISKYASKHPQDRFLLVSVNRPEGPVGFDRQKWQETLARIESYRGKFPVLSDDAYSTDSLYD
jgi:hypothetical protein